MGKGVPAALVGAATKSQLLRALSALRGTDTPQPAVVDVVAAVHNVVVPQLIEIERFVTLCYARFDAAGRRVLAGGLQGTPAPSTTTHATGRSRCSRALTRRSVSARRRAERTALHHAVWEAGDVFFFYSDGLTESRGPGRRDLRRSAAGGDRLGEGKSPPASLVEQVRQAVVAFSTRGLVRRRPSRAWRCKSPPPLRRFARDLHSDLSCLGAVHATSSGRPPPLCRPGAKHGPGGIRLPLRSR